MKTLLCITAAIVLMGEAVEARPSRGGPAPERMIRFLDTDDNGTVDLDEFVAGRTAQFERQDKNGDGFLTEEEFSDPARPARGARFLRRMDKDGDQSVSQGEIDAALQQRFDRLDKDGNGTITPDEFSERNAAMLKRLDRDGDGSISREDMDQMQRLRAERGQRLFGEADTNADNRVELNEALAQAEKRFDEIDSDGDGQVDLGELKSGMKRLKRSQADR